LGEVADEDFKIVKNVGGGGLGKINYGNYFAAGKNRI